MGRVRYAKSGRDLDRAQGFRTHVEALGQVCGIRSIRCRYETDAEVAQAVVPRPLEASVHPEVQLNFSQILLPLSPGQPIELRSAQFGVTVEYDDRPGVYLLTAPTSSESAAMERRECFGEPDKLAEIEFLGRGEHDLPSQKESVSATVERMGERYLSAIGRCVEELGPRELTQWAYCFKAFPGCEESRDFDQDPQLVRVETIHRFDRVWRMTGGIELWESAFDPVADLPVRNVLEFEYAEGTTVTTARSLRPVPGEWLLPFMHQRYDEPQVEGLDV